MVKIGCLLLALGLFTPAAARGQPVPVPGAQAERNEEKAKEAEEGTLPPKKSQHLPAYAAPPNYETTVRASVWDNDRIGRYNQPRWTASRLFPTTRVYVVPAGTLQIEVWTDAVLPFLSPSNVRLRNLYELEIGLGHRLQLDLYLRTEQQGAQGTLRVESEKIELRYALADWGKLWGNPTLYVELSRFTDAPMTIETKLLLGGNLARRMHWGLNLVYERDLYGEAGYNQYGLTGGLACTIVDRKFSAGAELQIESSDGGSGHRDILDQLWVFAGPSLQWRPVPPLHVDLVFLFGGLYGRQGVLGGPHTREGGMRNWLVVGWEL